ncbi:MAG: AAA family ATPase [Acidobacteriota bacterium]|nr:AAA family ATPase [Acidobacteriota bacterium]
MMAKSIRVVTAAAPPDTVEAVFETTTKATSRPGLALTSLRELLAEPDETTDYLVADRIAFGSVNILAGKPKAGKSTAARGLALEAARGGVWLGSACLPRCVWYLALEDKRSEVRRHLRQMGATGSEPVRFLFRQPAHDLIGRLHALAIRERPGLIIVDTLQRLIKADDLNDYSEVTTKLTPILTLARDTGAAVLLVHHAGKSERAGLDSVLGSTALTGSVDNVFILSRTERYRVLSSVQRIGPDLPETVLTLADDGRVEAGPSRHDADVQSVARAFIESLKAGSQLRADLLDTVEARRQIKLEALRRAVASGTIIRSGAGSKVDPHRFALSGDSGSGSQVPSISREPESSLLLFEEKSNVSRTDSGSQVPSVPAVPGEPESEGLCPVCSRDSCEDDPAACARQRSKVFRDVEAVFRPLARVGVQ